MEQLELHAVLIIVAIIIFIMYMVVIYNTLLSARNNIKRNWANIEVLLVQRNNELPKLIDACREYTGYEQRVFTEVTQLRSQQTDAQRAQTLAELGANEQALQQKTHELFALAEAYPQLQANETFVKLQNRVSELEEHIADRRTFYNESVTLYNIRLKSIPEILVVKLLGFKEAQLFSA